MSIEKENLHQQLEDLSQLGCAKLLGLPLNDAARIIAALVKQLGGKVIISEQALNEVVGVSFYTHEEGQVKIEAE